MVISVYHNVCPILIKQSIYMIHLILNLGSSFLRYPLNCWVLSFIKREESVFRGNYIHSIKEYKTNIHAIFWRPKLKKRFYKFLFPENLFKGQQFCFCHRRYFKLFLQKLPNDLWNIKIHEIMDYTLAHSFLKKTIKSEDKTASCHRSQTS